MEVHLAASHYNEQKQAVFARKCSRPKAVTMDKTYYSHEGATKGGKRCDCYNCMRKARAKIVARLLLTPRQPSPSTSQAERNPTAGGASGDLNTAAKGAPHCPPHAMPSGDILGSRDPSWRQDHSAIQRTKISSSSYATRRHSTVTSATRTFWKMRQQCRDATPPAWGSLKSAQASVTGRGRPRS